MLALEARFFVTTHLGNAFSLDTEELAHLSSSIQQAMPVFFRTVHRWLRRVVAYHSRWKRLSSIADRILSTRRPVK
jgi:hypothetical protein